MLNQGGTFQMPVIGCFRVKWMLGYQGMVCLAGNQIWWTWEVEDVFIKVKQGQKQAMKVFAKKLNKQIDELVQQVGVCLCSIYDYLYYYKRSVRKNLSSKFDRFLAARSHLDTNHGVNFSTPTSCQSAIFVRPLFAFVLCFLRQKIIKKTQMR